MIYCRSFMGTDGQIHADNGETPDDQILQMGHETLEDDFRNVVMTNDPLGQKVCAEMVDMADGEILNIGHGLGYSAECLEKKKKKYKTVDIDPFVFTLKRKAPKAKQLVGDYKRLSEKVDTIIFDISQPRGEHYDKDGIESCKKMLKKKGHYITRNFYDVKDESEIPDIPGFTLVETKTVTHDYSEPGHEKEYRRICRIQGKDLTEKEFQAKFDAYHKKKTFSEYIGKYRKD